jgi:hydrocephalus-inducing protein
MPFLYRVALKNTGSVTMDFSWQVVMDNFTPSFQRSVTFISEGERPESRVDVVEATYTPFSVEPAFGSVLPGKRCACIVKFSPLDINEYEGRLVCR